MPPSAGVLLSSPARQTLHDRLIMLSSSPVFPSLDDLIARNPKKPALRSGSHAVPIPDNAAPSFTSAADLLRSAQAEQVEELPAVVEEEPRKKTRKAPRKPARAPKTVIDLSADTPQSEGAAPTTKRRRKPLAEKNCKPVSKPLLSVDNGSSPLKEKPWKKYKAVPEEGGRQTASPKDSETTSKPRDDIEAKDTGNTSKHFQKKPPATTRAPKASTPEPLNLAPSLPRRLDWTPPKPDAINLMSDASETQEVHSPKSTNNPIGAAKDVFKNLKDTYGCKEIEAAAIAEEQDHGRVLGKRKLVEMVVVHESTSESEPQKPVPAVKTKAPKKKPRTITELATAAYIVKPTEPEGAAEPSQLESLRTFLDTDGDSQLSTSKASEDTKSKKKPRASKITKKKAEPKRQILLSPHAALRQSAAQDFVFGTSSQLAQEQSPTFLRDLQAAIRASNSILDDPFSSPVVAAKRKSANKLWSVGARDEDGELLDLEVIDLVNSPAFPEEDTTLNPILNPWKDLPQEAASKTALSTDLEILDADSPDKPPKSHFFLSQRGADATSKRQERINSSGAIEPPSPGPRVDVDDEPPPSNQEQSQEVDLVSTAPKSPAGPPRPKYELFTDVQLAKQVKSYGFKPVKKRSAMIALLDQCWTSKNRALTGSMASFSTTAVSVGPRAKSTDMPPSPSKATTTAKPRGRPKKATAGTDAKVTATKAKQTDTSPKRPRGRPRKDSSASAARPQTPVATTPKRKNTSEKPLAEIADSDSSSPFMSPGQTFSPVGVDLTVSGDTDMSLTVNPTDQQSALFRHITRAVTTAPRSQDPSEPSWHEKMLMYDPVILEDLTAWLNSGRLTEVGYDGEVSPADVKKWCESKSICCLWRINVNGKERKRF